jgi:phosphoglycerate dehydrogenase-like enzyme
MPDPVLLVTVPPSQLPDERLALVREEAPGFDVRRAEAGGPLAGVEAERVEVVLGRVDPAALAGMPALRWVQSWSAGVDWLAEADVELPAGLRVTSASGVHPVPIAEHVFAVVLALARGLPAHLRAQDRREWAPDVPGGTFELSGRRLVLLGAGEIGARIARLADAFGVFVTAVRHHPDEAVEGAAHVLGTDALLDVLPHADLLVVTLPLTGATRGLVGAGALAALPRHAVVVNVGRGGVVDQGALVAALEAGRVGAAALDVFEDEPLPDDSPLWAMGNVIVTPHAAGHTPHYADRALAIFLGNLGRYRRGEPLRHAVDLGAGY